MNKRPTLTEHIQMGEALQRAHADISTVLAQCSRSYRKGGSAKTSPYAAANQVMKALDHLRSLLDSQSCEELPADQWEPALYYGGNQEIHNAYVQRVLSAQAKEKEPQP